MKSHEQPTSEAFSREQGLVVAKERIEHLHELFFSQKNPLYAWKAILHAFAHELPLPEWCLDYLKGCAIGIYRLSTQVIGHDFQQDVHALGKSPPNKLLEPEQAMQELPSALDFPGKGRNLFAELRRDVAYIEDSTILEYATVFGLTEDQAIKRIMTRRSLEHKRSATNRTKAGLRLRTRDKGKTPTTT